MFHGTNRNVETGDVEYCLIKDLQKVPPELDELPFLKRNPYKDEEEFRVIYRNKSQEMESKQISIDLDCIERINLSPWLPSEIVPTIREVVQNMPGCASLRVSKTTLIESTVWKNIATRNNT